MLTKKLVAVLAGLVVLGFVVSAGGDDEKKEHKAILNAVNRVNGQLDGILANLGHLLTGLDDIVVKLDGLIGVVDPIKETCTKPDLVPLPVPGGGFCRVDSQGRLHVLVRNQGGGGAVATTTSVLFRTPSGTGGAFCGAGCAEKDIATQVLAGFSGIDLPMDIPAGCFDADLKCQFKIAVNSTNAETTESDYTNNNAAGECIAGIL